MTGVLLVILGAWAGIVPFIGPYLDFAYTPAVNDAWNWTAGRGWLNVGPGAAAFFGGLLLLGSTSRLVTLAGGWLAAAAGAWLIVGPSLAVPLQLGGGSPDPLSGTWTRTLETLFFYSAVGAAILFLAALALGRLSVHSVRDVRAAERRAAEEEAAAAEQRRQIADQTVREREQAAATRAEQPVAAGPTQAGAPPTPDGDAGRHERIDPNAGGGPSRTAEHSYSQGPPSSYTSAPPPPEQRP